MWLIGAISLMSLVGGIAGFLSRTRNTPIFATDFNLELISEEYARIVAPLAGFSVAAAVFLANLLRVAQSTFFVDVMALFLIAFIMLMGAAIMFATFRGGGLQSLPERQHEVHCMLYIVCNLMFYLGLSMSWLRLRPLLISIDLFNLANVFTWLLLFTLLAGAIRLGAWLHTLLGVRLIASILVPVIPIIAAIVYGLTLAPQSTIFWPAAKPVLSIAILVFAIGSIAYGVETVMITFYGQHEFHHRLLRIGKRLLIPYLSAAITAIGLLWFAVALE